MKALSAIFAVFVIGAIPVFAHEAKGGSTEGLFGLKAEYLHVLLNPLPVYGLLAGAVVLLTGLLARSKVTWNVGLDTESKQWPHPQAPNSPMPIATPMLMAGSQGLVLPLSTNQTEMKHGQHQQTPAGKGGPQPAEHKHDHEQPKTKEEKK